MKSLSSVLFFLVFALAYSSAQSKTTTYTKADAVAKSITKLQETSLDTLAFYLTSTLTEPSDKVRSIYYWCAHHIAYDADKYYSRMGKPNNVSDASQNADAVFDNRIAVCEGYSNLFCDLCTRAGLQCFVVKGQGKPPGRQSCELHGWNAVFINNKWNLIDVTWSAGGVNTKHVFEWLFNESYFLMQPDSFIKTHYPEDPMWQLLEKPINFKQFNDGQFTNSNKEVFNYNDTIASYINQCNSERMLSSLQRAVAYNPTDILSKTNLEIAINNKSADRMNDAVKLASDGGDYYSEYVAIVNKAKAKHSTELMNENEEKLKSLLMNAKHSLLKAIEIYKSVPAMDSKNQSILNQNISAAEQNLAYTKQQEAYLTKYFNTPKIKRAFVL